VGVRALLGAIADGPGLASGGDERTRRQAALRRELGALAWLALATFLAGVLLAAAGVPPGRRAMVPRPCGFPSAPSAPS
jgi:hypothetical protein